MKTYTEQDIRKAFQAGMNWGCTFQGWFTPSEQDTSDRITKCIESLNTPEKEKAWQHKTLNNSLNK